MEVELSRPPIGSRSATVSVLTNSPVTPTVEIKTTCWARNNQPRIVQVLPPRVAFRTDENSADPKTVIVTTLEEADNLLVHSAECDLPFVAVETANVEESHVFSSNFVRRKYRYFLRLRDPHPVGRFFGSLSIRTITSGSDSPRVARRIPVEVTSRAPIYADPESLFGTLVPEGELAVWEVTLRQNDGEASCRIVSIECDVRWLRAQMLDKTSNASSDGNLLGRLSVKVVVPPTDSPANATVVAKTDHPQRPEIRIPVTIAKFDE